MGAFPIKSSCLFSIFSSATSSCLFSIFVVAEIVQVFVTTTVRLPRGLRNRLGVPGARFRPARRSLLVPQKFPVISLREIPAEDEGRGRRREGARGPWSKTRGFPCSQREVP
jgi:hypothetical protein